MHHKGYYRTMNGKVIHVEEGGQGVGRPAELHERTAIGKHKSGSFYLRASDAEDGAKIKGAAEHLGIDTVKKRASANHFGRVGAYDQYHCSTIQDAQKIHEHLKGQAEAPKHPTVTNLPNGWKHTEGRDSKGNPIHSVNAEGAILGHGKTKEEAMAMAEAATRPANAKATWESKQKDVQGMSDEDYNAHHASLEDENQHDEARVLRAKRHGSLHHVAEAEARQQHWAGRTGGKGENDIRDANDLDQRVKMHNHPSTKALDAAKAVKGRDAEEMLDYSRTAHSASEKAERTGRPEDHAIAHTLHMAAGMSHAQAQEDSDGYEDDNGVKHAPLPGNEEHGKAWMAHHAAEAYHKAKAGGARVPVAEMKAATAEHQRNRPMQKAIMEAEIQHLDRQMTQVGGDPIALAAIEMRREALKSHYEAGTRTVNGRVVSVAAHETRTPPAQADYMDRARTIHQQLGGNKFNTMTGAKDFVGSQEGLHFRLPKAAKNGINHVQVHLDQSTDTYKVVYGHMAKKDGVPEHKVISSHEGVYGDDLQDHFTRHTGLYTHL